MCVCYDALSLSLDSHGHCSCSFAHLSPFHFKCCATKLSPHKPKGYKSKQNCSRCQLAASAQACVREPALLSWRATQRTLSFCLLPAYIKLMGKTSSARLLSHTPQLILIARSFISLSAVAAAAVGVAAAAVAIAVSSQRCQCQKDVLVDNGSAEGNHVADFHCWIFRKKFNDKFKRSSAVNVAAGSCSSGCQSENIATCSACQSVKTVNRFSKSLTA